jgi:hypothetical protein
MESALITHFRRLAAAQRDGLDGIARRRVEPVHKLHDALEILAPVRQDHQPCLGHGRQHRLAGQKRADDLGHFFHGAVAQGDDAGLEIAAAPRARVTGGKLARHVKRHDPVGLGALHDGEAVQLQHVEENLVDRRRGHGIGRDHRDRALHPVIKDKVAPGRLRHDLHEIAQARVPQIKRDLRRAGHGQKKPESDEHGQKAVERHGGLSKIGCRK